MNEFWCCYVEGSGGFKIAHFEEEEARNEAERLSLLPENQGKKVWLLFSEAFCIAGVPIKPSVEWHEV